MMGGAMTTINMKSGSGRLQRYWTRFWMCFAGPGFWGRIASRFASYLAPPHKDRVPLSKMETLTMLTVYL